LAVETQLSRVMTRSPLRRSEVRGTSFAVGLLLLAIAAPTVFGEPIQFPFLTIFPAVVVIAVVAGTRPAFYALIASSLWAGMFVGAPPIATLIYFILGGLVIYALDSLAIMAQRLREEKELTDTLLQQQKNLLQQQKNLFSELQHRVANNLTFLSSLLHLARKKVQEEPTTAIDAYDDIILRMEVMARLHRRLHSPESLEQTMPDYLRTICSDLLEATGAKNIVCVVHADDVRLDLGKLTAMSLLIVESLTNSLKHAFTDRDGGTIGVVLQTLPDGKLLLQVDDDGPGITQGYSSRGGLGLKIMNSLAKQLGGKLRLPKAGKQECGLERRCTNCVLLLLLSRFIYLERMQRG
jgi:two-component sensor histidine kinase